MPSSPELPLKLLLVEDSAMDAELVALTLEENGVSFTCDIVDSLSTYQQCVKEHDYDAVLADYRLPGFTAYEALAALQSAGRDVPLILVTGSLGEEAAVDCIKAGMTDYVMKDRLFRLPMVLRRSLQEYALRRQKLAADQRLRQQTRQVAIMNQVLRKMRETLVLDDLMQSTMDVLHQVLGVDICALLMQGNTAQRSAWSETMMVRCVSNATPERDRLLGRKFECGFQRYYGDRLLQGQSIVLSTIPIDSPVDILSISQSQNIQSTLIVPMLCQKTYLGAITLHQCQHQRDWSREEVDLVEAIAGQFALAIHQAQLFEQVQQQAQREQFLNQLGQTLNSSLDLDFILQELVRLAGEYFGVDRVVLLRHEAEWIVPQTEWRASDAVIPSLDLPLPMHEWQDFFRPEGDYLTQKVWHAPTFLEDPWVQKIPSARLRGQRKHIQSMLSTPILVRGQHYGELSLDCTQTRRTFTTDEIQLVQRLADATAIALFNAQSYERLEKLVQERTQELEQEKRISEAANRAKSEFLTHMSHELRTPLTGILGFADVLSRQLHGPLSSLQRQYVEGIRSCGDHLLELINDLLDLSKIEAGREELFFEPVLVQEVCDACMSMVQETAQKRGLRLILDIAQDVTVCTADKRRLKQILSNLLANAVKFTDEGSVTLKVWQQAKALHFAVIDTGIGIAPSDQSRLFQAFQQLNGGLNRKYEGTGLGLVLSSKLARLHGGQITVSSELGKGSCFTVILPEKIPPLSPPP
ncbi:GAF domain-containing protein [Thermoleptolyngbya sp. PKUAC-SCTB121]|uniref:hybrid sensor histidine kinase/response regulator n=1 Tax=Thermoleptolyngbya sp. PKUAC-SCTB121 TaxID=2811482 RepID=UPI001CEC30E7|nr:GAF domain-containing protein [Thermoleptolyngbya sp. PKUAC-SCTB121]